MRQNLVGIILLAAVALPFNAFGLPPTEPDPHGIVIKPIPEKLVVLTFDDACRSHATFVGPLLKKYGFGGTFYITRFGNAALDPKMYMSWEEIKVLEDMGFEIGNHTWSHSQFGGGSSVEGCLSEVKKIEELCLANKIAKPTTFCWPIYTVGTQLFPMLSDRGYLFARSGGRNDRPYSPLVENPFETPSFTIVVNTPLETFTSAAKRATRGRISIFTFHGVPDVEHPGVGVEPARFEEMMKYLKDNKYNVIAMRDIARYVDAKKAAKLLPIPAVLPDITITDPAELVASKTFESPKVVCRVDVSAGAAGEPAKMAFGGIGKGHVVIHAPIGGKMSLAHSAPYLLELLPKKEKNDWTSISVFGTTLQTSSEGLRGGALTLSNAVLKLQDPLNTWENFSSPTTLVGANTVQALDNHRAVMTGKITGSGSVTYTGFFPIGRVSSDSDYTGNTRIAQDEWFGKNPDDSQGHDDLMFGISGTRPFGTGVLTIAGKVGTRMGIAWFAQGENAISNAVTLETSLVFSWKNGLCIDMPGAISGPGSLVKVFDARDNGSTLKIRGDNSYRGGTRFFSGNLLIYHVHSLGTGPVALGGKSSDPHHAMSFRNQSAMTVASAFELVGITDATVDGTCPTFAGHHGEAANDPAAATEFNTTGGDLTLSGAISGSGGLLKTGPNALVLTGANSYTGSTVVTKGTLSLANARRLGERTDVYISEGATLDLNFQGEMHIPKLYLDGKIQLDGSYSAVNCPNYIKGTGVLSVQAEKHVPK